MAHQDGQGAGDGLSYDEATVGQRHLSNLTNRKQCSHCRFLRRTGTAAKSKMEDNI